MALLGGRVVACLEARHADEMAELVTRHGGIPYPAPCMREVHEPESFQVQRAVELIRGDAVDIAVFLTGVGVNTILDGATRLGSEREFLDGLCRKTVAARGPKALNALRKLGVTPAVVAPEPYTSDTLLDAMRGELPLAGKHVLVQRYGAPAPAFTGGLRQLGARVTEVAPYRWARPLDEDAVVRMIEDLSAGWIDVLAATSAAQVDHLFDIARDRDCLPQLRSALAQPALRVAAQGIVCASAFERHGVAVDFVSPRTSMGAMVLELARVTRAAPAESAAAPDRAELVAFCFAGTVAEPAVADAIARLRDATTVLVLAGRRRSTERLAERVAVRRGLPVRSVQPARRGHPAESLVRQADRVLIVSGDGGESAAGALTARAQRYAKPVTAINAAG